MKIKEYLQNQSDINMTALAKEMYPDNSSAKSKLSNKLKGLRNWLQTDEDLARAAIQKLGKKLLEL